MRGPCFYNIIVRQPGPFLYVFCMLSDVYCLTLIYPSSTVSLLHFFLIKDSSDVIQKDVCYGGTSQFRLLFFYGRMYFTPSKTGGSRKLVMEKGKVKDPRFKSSPYSVTLTKLTERDDGTFSVSIAGERPFDIVKLNILECAEQVVRSYKAMYSFNVPREAEFLEFTPILSVDQPRVLWNRTDPQTNTGGRGHVKHNVWEISELTQADNGLYNFRKKDKTLLSRIKLIVKANTRSYELSPEERLDFTFDLEPNSCNIYFISESDLNLREFETEIVRQGRLERKGSDEVDCVGFQLSKPCGILMDSFQRSCVGRFEVRDQNGNMALVVSLKMKPNRRSYELSPGERLDFTFDLEPNSCNIYFISESDLNLKEFETEIVRQGRLQRKGSDEVNCGGFQLSKPCGILIESLQSSCGGRFEVIDQHGNKALVVSLKMKRRVNHKTKKTIRVLTVCHCSHRWPG
ncbi:uncharacterized protein LOC122991108 isoform X1 [Thunnus albacares]|uniref:uncharacterized protein LOC122991108 isoform X1 n=1 Tax=Thunnus albacares TaxID=8236 RepID=UPI001CF67A53|nr:uncharacterized protein LOC122991108 isoform X1 [Thunnus albacares]